jgi:imidazolonepropionase
VQRMPRGMGLVLFLAFSAAALPCLLAIGLLLESQARRALDAGVTVAIASNCNPGSSYTTSMSFCVALAVRDMHMTIDEAIQAITTGGATALQRTDIGRLTPGSAGHATILDAPTHHHLAYRPGVPLIRRTIGPLG